MTQSQIHSENNERASDEVVDIGIPVIGNNFTTDHVKACGAKKITYTLKRID